MNYWLKIAGTGADPITNADWAAVARRWGQVNGDFSGFSRRPSVQPGDRFVVYAAGSGQVFGAPRIYAVEEVVSRPKLSGHDRWKWGVQTKMVIPGPLMEEAPTLDAIDVKTTSVCSQSHIRLTDNQGLEAEALIRGAAERHGTPYHDPEPPQQPSGTAEPRNSGGPRPRMALPELDAALRIRRPNGNSASSLRKSSAA